MNKGASNTMKQSGAIGSIELVSDGQQRAETDASISRQNSLSIRELTLYDCLENKYGFHAFLCHTYKEFSVENVLAVVELQQFQQYYSGKKRDKRLSVQRKMENEMELKSVSSESLSNMICSEEEKKQESNPTSKRSGKRKKRMSRLSRMSSIEDLHNVQMQNHTFSLPSNLPNSSIVHDNELSMREKVIKLLDKYVVNGGEFELNLGSSQRNELLNKKDEINNISDDECAAIFNATIYAIIALMHDSFIRFQQTNNYFQLRQELLGNDDHQQNINNDNNKTQSLL